MRQIFIALMMALPMLASAQDNTWERIEQEPVSKENKDAKYLLPDAVPAMLDPDLPQQAIVSAMRKYTR